MHFIGNTRKRKSQSKQAGCSRSFDKEICFSVKVYFSRPTWNRGSAAAVSIFAKFGSGIYILYICIMDQYMHNNIPA